MERKAAQQKKNLSEEIKQGLTVHSTAQINKAKGKNNTYRLNIIFLAGS